MTKKYIKFFDARVSAICLKKHNIIYFNVNAKKSAKLIYVL